MKVTDTEIEGVKIIEPRVFGDPRGYFFESFVEQQFAALVDAGVRFVQDNQSRSQEGVLRGLHFQRPPHAQAKLVRAVTGRIFDVAVDLRAGSPTYGRWIGTELSADNFRQLYIPAGLAHGFYVMSGEAVIAYKCSDYYHPECEGGIAWNDPTLAIEWPIAPGLDAPVLSARDCCHPSFDSFVTPFV